jgi:hypothetical protein
MKVLEIKGYKSLKALNAFHTLMLGLKMLPSYMGESYEDFYSRISEMNEADQEKLIREAVLFVELQKEEVEAIVGFCSDKNGVPYSAENMKNMKPDQLVEMIVAVSKEIAKIKIGFVSEAEKKNFQDSQLI